MTANEIKNLPIVGYDNSDVLVGKEKAAIELAIAVQHAILMREICYQLAVMNEHEQSRLVAQSREATSE